MMDIDELFEKLDEIDYSSPLGYETAFYLFNSVKNSYPYFLIPLEKGNTIFRSEPI